MGHPRPPFRLFSSFQTNITIHTINKWENWESIQNTVLGFKQTTFGTWVSSHNHETRVPVCANVMWAYTHILAQGFRQFIFVFSTYTVQDEWLSDTNFWWLDSNIGLTTRELAVPQRITNNLTKKCSQVK